MDGSYRGNVGAYVTVWSDGPNLRDHLLEDGRKWLSVAPFDGKAPTKAAACKIHHIVDESRRPRDALGNPVDDKTAAITQGFGFQEACACANRGEGVP